MVVAGFSFKRLLEIAIALDHWVTWVVGVWWIREGRYPGYVAWEYPWLECS